MVNIEPQSPSASISNYEATNLPKGSLHSFGEENRFNEATISPSSSPNKSEVRDHPPRLHTNCTVFDSHLNNLGKAYVTPSLTEVPTRYVKAIMISGDHEISFVLVSLPPWFERYSKHLQETAEDVLTPKFNKNIEIRDSNHDSIVRTVRSIEEKRHPTNSSMSVTVLTLLEDEYSSQAKLDQAVERVHLRQGSVLFFVSRVNFFGKSDFYLNHKVKISYQ